jgi:hypothetical protein
MLASAKTADHVFPAWLLVITAVSLSNVEGMIPKHLERIDDKPFRISRDRNYLRCQREFRSIKPTELQLSLQLDEQSTLTPYDGSSKQLPQCQRSSRSERSFFAVTVSPASWTKRRTVFGLAHFYETRTRPSRKRLISGIMTQIPNGQCDLRSCDRLWR